MGLVAADMSNEKRKYLQSKGIDIDRIYDTNARHARRVAPRMARARASSHYLKYGNKKLG